MCRKADAPVSDGRGRAAAAKRAESPVRRARSLLEVCRGVSGNKRRGMASPSLKCSGGRALLPGCRYDTLQSSCGVVLSGMANAFGGRAVAIRFMSPSTSGTAIPSPRRRRGQSARA